MAQLTYFETTGTWDPSPPDTDGVLNGIVAFTMLVDNNGVLVAPTLDIPAVIVPIVDHTTISNNKLTPIKLLANTSALGISGTLYYRADFTNITYTKPGEQPVPVTLKSVTFAASTNTNPVRLEGVTPAAGVLAAQLATVTSAGITDATTIGRELLTAPDLASARTIIGAASDADAEHIANKNQPNGYAGLDANSRVAAAITALRLATARNINGVPFDGTASITVVDSTAEKTVNKNQPSGYAGLDSGGRVPAALWPSGIDEIIEYANLAAFPGTGAAGIIYLALDSGKTYRWSGSTYTEISASPGSTDAVPEGVTNLYYTNARADARITAAHLVPWSAGTAGILPATSGQHLTTQGGVTLDDGTGKIAVPNGGTLDGVTIGATTAAASVRSFQLQGPSTQNYASVNSPWINYSGFATGNAGTRATTINQFGFNDTIVYTGSGFVYGLQFTHNVATTAVGPRLGAYFHLTAAPTATNTPLQAQYVSLGTRVETSVNLGGTASNDETLSSGSHWATWIFGALNNGATNQSFLAGIELDLAVATGASVACKYGLLISLAGNDAVRGTIQDSALCVAKGSAISGGGTPGTFQYGLMFGTRRGAGTGSEGANWPFATDSVLIGAGLPGTFGNPAGTGIDFSPVTFSDCAIKTGPAAIQMAGMSSPPSTPAAGKLRIYADSNGLLRLLSSTANTVLGPGSGLTKVAIQTGTYAAGLNQIIPFDLSSAVGVVNLPADPPDGTEHVVKIVKQVALPGSPNTLTVNCGGTNKFNTTTGVATLTMSVPGEVKRLQFSATDATWSIISEGASVTQYDLRYLLASAPLPNGTKATTQTAGDDSTNVATTAYVDTGLTGKVSTPTTSYSEYIGTVNGATAGVTNAAVPAGAIAAIVTLIGPGGAGGSGAVEPSGTVACGGGGGASSAVALQVLVPQDALGTQFSVSIPTAPLGGAAQSSSGSNGNNGGTGSGRASFTTGSYGLYVFGGGSGQGGTTTTGTGGTAAVGPVAGQAGASASATGGVGTAAIPQNAGAPGAGGAGGGLASTPVATNGGNGSANNLFNSSGTPAGGTTAGGSPGTGTSPVPGTSGQGAGGGASSTTGNGQAGASALGYGAGGGGGGAAQNGHSSGAGGNGAPGYCLIKWLFV